MPPAPARRASELLRGLLFKQEVTAEPNQLIHRLLAYLVARHQLDYRPATPVREVTAGDAGYTVVTASGQHFATA